MRAKVEPAEREPHERLHRLFNRHADDLVKLTRSLGCEEDVVQDVYMKLLTKPERLAELRDDEHANAWLIKCVRRECITQYRRRKCRNHKVAVLGTELESVIDSNVDRLTDRVRAARQIQLLIRSLSRDHRTALGYYFAEVDSRVAANAEGIDAPTLRKRQSRALAKLKELWSSNHA